MNGAHAHLIVNHVPVLGTLFGLLLLAAGGVWRSGPLKKAALAAFVLAAAGAAGAYFTGEPAEGTVEGMAGIGKSALESHESLARFAFAGSAILGLYSLLALAVWRRSPDVPAAGWGAALALGAAVAGLMAVTANLGGNIHHTEIQTAAISGDQPGFGREATPRDRHEEREHEHDD